MVERRWAITSVVLFFASSERDSWTARSDSLSKAEVASSKISSGGFFKNTRAIEMRCFCPPESLVPRCPTCVSYPSGSDSINSAIFARFAASAISSAEASGQPYAMFSAMVPSKRYTSC